MFVAIIVHLSTIFYAPIWKSVPNYRLSFFLLLSPYVATRHRHQISLMYAIYTPLFVHRFYFILNAFKTLVLTQSIIQISILCEWLSFIFITFEKLFVRCKIRYKERLEAHICNSPKISYRIHKRFARKLN